jgi:hypothetical protein
MRVSELCKRLTSLVNQGHGDDKITVADELGRAAKDVMDVYNLGGGEVRIVSETRG